MDEARIQVYTDPDTKRRVEAAAAKHNLPVTDYCLRAIHRQLAADEVGNGDAAEGRSPNGAAAAGDDLIARLRTLRAAILVERSGHLLDVDDFVEQVRAGRDEESTGLR